MFRPVEVGTLRVGIWMPGPFNCWPPSKTWSPSQTLPSASLTGSDLPALIRIVFGGGRGSAGAGAAALASAIGAVAGGSGWSWNSNGANMQAAPPTAIRERSLGDS